MVIYSGFTRIYPLKMVIFHSYVNVYQRVTEGATTKEKRVETMIWIFWEHWTSSKHHACTIPASQNTIQSDWYHLPSPSHHVSVDPIYTDIQQPHHYVIPSTVKLAAQLHLSWWCCNSLFGRAFLPAHPPASSAGWWQWWVWVRTLEIQKRLVESKLTNPCGFIQTGYPWRWISKLESKPNCFESYSAGTW